MRIRIIRLLLGLFRNESLMEDSLGRAWDKMDKGVWNGEIQGETSTTKKHSLS